MLYVMNALKYTIFGFFLGIFSAILNDIAVIPIVDKFLDDINALKGIRDITRKQAKTVMTTPHGLLYLCTVLPYVVVFAVLFYKFYLATTADDSDNLISITGQALPAGVRAPPEVVWVAVLSIFVTFSSFAVCHINKLTLANPKLSLIHI